MSIDSSVSRGLPQKYLMAEDLYYRKVKREDQRSYTISDLFQTKVVKENGVDKIVPVFESGLYERMKVMATFDPYAVTVDEYLGDKVNNKGALMAFNGFYPHPRLVTPQKWSDTVRLFFEQLGTKCKTFFVTHFHMNKEVRDNARKIQRIYNEMHNGASALTYIKMRGGPVFTLNMNKRSAVDARQWNTELMREVRSALGQPSLIEEEKERAMLNMIHHIHGEDANYDDMRRFFGGDHNYGEVQLRIIDTFATAMHQPIVEYMAACQRLYQAVEVATHNVTLADIDASLKGCLDAYNKCIEVYTQIMSQLKPEIQAMVERYK